MLCCIIETGSIKGVCKVSSETSFRRGESFLRCYNYQLPFHPFLLFIWELSAPLPGLQLQRQGEDTVMGILTAPSAGFSAGEDWGKGILSSKEYKRPQWWWCLLGFSCSSFPCGVRGSNLVLRCSRLRTRVMQTPCFLCFSMRSSQFWSLAKFLVLLHYSQELSQSNFYQHWTCLFIDFVVLIRETSIGTSLPTILLTSAVVPFTTDPSIYGRYSPQESPSNVRENWETHQNPASEPLPSPF